jgi:hypothetical protein
MDQDMSVYIDIVVQHEFSTPFLRCMIIRLNGLILFLGKVFGIQHVNYEIYLNYLQL